MKSLLLLLFILTGFASGATTYYFSNAGSDANSGTSASAPWQTISKFNAVFASKSPGDNFLFNKGDVFYGSMIISRSGTSGSPLTIGSYGTGANPAISGFTTVSAWTNLGSNIWESTSAISTLSTCNMVAINAVNTPMGRIPNSGYYTYQSHSGTTSITSGSLTGTPNWTGAFAVIRKNNYTIEQTVITAQSGSTITCPGSYEDPTNNCGFFIQNDARTLDVQNEWYYNPSSKKIRIYSTSSPTNVQVATVKDLVAMPFRDYITIDGIDFRGANENFVNISMSKFVTIQNCNGDFAGLQGILGTNGAASPGTASATGAIIINNSLNHVMNFSIALESNFGNATVSHNKVRNNGLFVGSGRENLVNYAIWTSGANSVVQYNDVDTVGYSGIVMSAPNTDVSYNLVNHYCLIKADGGGIYTAGTQTGSIIHHNTVLNGIGNNDGTDNAGNPLALYAEGIYLDNVSNGFNVYDNNIANVSDCGIYLHNAANITLRRNTIYNFGIWGLLVGNENSTYTTSGLNIKSNILFGRTTSPRSARYETQHNNFTTWGPIDSNYYARPMDDNLTINVSPANVNKTIAQWQSYAPGQEVHINKSPKAITNVNDLRFEYNATAVSKTISLDGNYIDVKNASYNGTITLAPYTSAVLIRNGVATNQSPTSDAGADQAITLPVNNVNLSGSGADADGSISAYSWTKTSGPAATITNASSASTSVTGLTQGVYQFELKVTDNKAATAVNTVQVTVTAAANTAPTSNAGADQAITLPVNNVNLSGSGADADGSISAYSWTKTSGPAATITNASSASTSVTGLTQGVYQFELKVTDNSAATGVNTVQVTVTAAANTAPTSNAGADQAITLPTSNVNLSGSGADADGSISAYSWTKTSGPAATITNASSASTSVTGMVQGVYQFELKVTDNSAATAVNTVQVTVNAAAANTAPTSNAGADQAITLPVNNVNLSGSGADADGSISAYSWTKTSGPAATITNANSASTSVTGLTQGVYQFELKVTDNNAATAVNTVQVTVTAAAANTAPTANAGADQAITLPTSNVNLSGSGTDADGSISAYSWTKTSGPASGTITNASSASTSVTGMVQGVYQFELKVTDNNGATNVNTVQVTVNAGAGANAAPKANAGTDQTINLPKSYTSISGSGTDADGTISTYKWTKISGPSATIFSSTSKSSFVFGLSQGIYKFQLAVTDNKGVVGKDSMIITVNKTSVSMNSVDPGIIATESKINRNLVYQNFPNPFSSITTIRYDVAEKALVKIVITDAIGIQVAALTNEIKQAGSYQIQWNAGNIPSGTYYYKVIIGENETTKKMLKIK